MPTRYDSDDDDVQDGRAGDREISLGTGTVLAIFLALALVCSLFFGLGYSMGRKSTPPAPVIATAAPSSTFTPAGEKPTPGTLTSPESSSAASTRQVVQPLEDGSTKDGSARDGSATSSPTTSKPALHAAAKPLPAAAETLPTPVIPGAPATYVQIAAVSRKEDADILLAALKHRGYTGLVRQQPQDKLLHIQVGPFPSKKDAEAMRQRLITDGYNPIVK